VKLFFGLIELQKLTILAFLMDLNWYFDQFWHLFCAKIYKNINSEPTKLTKIFSFELLETPKLISRKI